MASLADVMRDLRAAVLNVVKMTQRPAAEVLAAERELMVHAGNVKALCDRMLAATAVPEGTMTAASAMAIVQFSVNYLANKRSGKNTPSDKAEGDRLIKQFQGDFKSLADVLGPQPQAAAAPSQGGYAPAGQQQGAGGVLDLNTLDPGVLSLAPTGDPEIDSLSDQISDLLLMKDRLLRDRRAAAQRPAAVSNAQARPQGAAAPSAGAGRGGAPQSAPRFSNPNAGASQRPASQYPMQGQQAQRPPVQKVKVNENDFETMKVIGRGSYGRVLLVRKKDSKRVYAMKVLKKAVIAARGEIEHTMTEKNVLAKIRHPFLVRMHYSFQNPSNLYMVMDFINGGELFHHLTREQRFGEDRTRFYAAQIVSGMAHLHSHGIIYRDLKPENLLLSAQGNIIMTDFGLAKEGLSSKDSLTATFCGTPEYIAPEVIKGERYTKAIDWWSVGTIIYEMLAGLPPFYTEDQTESYNLILFAELKIPPYFSPQVSDIIRQFLARDPKVRLQDYEKIRAHPWFRSIDFGKLERFEIQPPFVPVVKDVEDVGNIDEEFLMEDIDDDGEDDSMYRNRTFRQEDFGGFSYNEDYEQ